MPERQISDLSDDALLGLLAQALSPRGAEPLARSVSQIRALAAKTIPSDGRRAAVLRWRHRAGWWAPVILLGATATGVGSAYAAGVPVERPFRALASDIGLSAVPAGADQQGEVGGARHGHGGAASHGRHVPAGRRSDGGSRSRSRDRSQGQGSGTATNAQSDGEGSAPVPSPVQTGPASNDVASTATTTGGSLAPISPSSRLRGNTPRHHRNGKKGDHRNRNHRAHASEGSAGSAP